MGPTAGIHDAEVIEWVMACTPRPTVLLGMKGQVRCRGVLTVKPAACIWQSGCFADLCLLLLLLLLLLHNVRVCCIGSSRQLLPSGNSSCAATINDSAACFNLRLRALLCALLRASDYSLQHVLNLHLTR